jgi:hypothetical protein
MLWTALANQTGGVKTKPFVIYTASDKKFGDFLVDHWFRSLRESVDLSRIDVRVLDFGLSPAQRFYLEHNGVGIRRCTCDGHVAVIRFRDLARDLADSSYEQVLAVDGGDIVFQDDIAPLFLKDQDRFRAVQEDLKSGFEIFLKEEYFSRETIGEIQRVTDNRPQINAGFLLGPRNLILDLCGEIERLVLDKRDFGPDQLVVNKVLYETDFVPLPRGCNFVLATAQEGFVVEKGVFYSTVTHGKIPVVHNAGNWKFLRPIDNFGYGPGKNRVKPDMLSTLQFFHHSNDMLLTARSWIRRFARTTLEKASSP